MLQDRRAGGPSCQVFIEGAPLKLRLGGVFLRVVEPAP